MVSTNARLTLAHAQDRALGEAVMARLLEDGRSGHPAIAHLRVVLADKTDETHFINLAAIAFETAARLRLGEMGGALARDGKRDETLAAFLLERTPTAWESSSRMPYTEVDWRKVVAAAAEDVRKNAFEMPMFIPGAHLYEAYKAEIADREDFLSMILGQTVRDDTLDPVATSGNFLAQAMPGYQDLDLLFRQHREAQIALMDGDD